MTRHWTRLALAFALAAVFAAACGGSEKKEEPSSASSGATTAAGTSQAAAAAQAAKKGGTLRIYATSDSAIGNPVVTKWTAWLWPMFDPLVEYDDRAKVQPALAKSWQFSPDNKTITFALADGVKWHDGQPFTADDVVFTFDAIKNEKTNTPHKTRLKVGDDWATWTAVDPKTVKIDLPSPYAAFFSGLSEIGIIPKHLLAGSSDINTDPYNRKPVGTGPFKLAEYKQDEFMALEANREYFKGAPNLDRLILVFYTEPDAAAAALLKGDIDGMYAYPEQQPQFEKDKKFRVHTYAFHQAITLAFNQKDPILADKKVRQALSLGVDKKAMMDTVTRGRGEVATTMWAPKGPLGPWASTDLPADEFNATKAKTLLEEAGWKLGGDGIRTKDGQRLSLSLPYNTVFDEYKEASTIIERQFRDLGVEVKVRGIQSPALVQLRQELNADPKERSLELQEWPHAVNFFDPDVFRELHSSAQPPAGLNYMFFKNARVDELVAQARVITDPEKRRPLYNEVQKLLKEDFAYLPLYFVFDSFTYITKLKGIPDDSLRSVYFVQRFPEKLWMD